MIDNKKPILIYIAGAYTAGNAWEVEQNVRKAEVLSLKVARAGFMPVCPHTQSRFFFGQCNEPFWIAGTLEMMRMCSAIVLAPGYEDSKGTAGELAQAARDFQPSFETVKELVEHAETFGFCPKVVL